LNRPRERAFKQFKCPRPQCVKSNSLVQLIFEKFSDILISNAAVRRQERLGQCKRWRNEHVGLSSTLLFVQRTALSILTGQRT